MRSHNYTCLRCLKSKNSFINTKKCGCGGIMTASWKVWLSNKGKVKIENFERNSLSLSEKNELISSVPKKDYKKASFILNNLNKIYDTINLVEKSFNGPAVYIFKLNYIVHGEFKEAYVEGFDTTHVKNEFFDWYDVEGHKPKINNIDNIRRK